MQFSTKFNFCRILNSITIIMSIRLVRGINDDSDTTV